MAACTWLVTLLPIVVTSVLADSNITLFSRPVNITSLKLAFRNALNQSFSKRLEDHLMKYVDLFKNVSFDCTSAGEECIPGIPSCCPGLSEDDVDLACLPDGDTFTCSKPGPGGEELAGIELDALQYGDSKGMLESHPWANSWEFQSRSEMEREELQAAEEAEWKKNWKPSPTDNYWVEMYKKMKKGSKGIWNDVRKLKKLKEFKDTLVEKYKKRMARTKPPKTTPEDKSEEIRSGNPEVSEQPESKTAEKTPKHEHVASWLYPDVSGAEGKESDESVIKFSDEIPKREKKIDFRIDEIIKDAAKFVEKKLKEKTQAKESKSVVPTCSLEGGDPLRLREIEDTEDKLMNEIEELKLLKKRRGKKEEEYRPNEDNVEELIKKQVRMVLDEERKLDKLRKIEELKRLEGGMNYQGQIQT